MAERRACPGRVNQHVCGDRDRRHAAPACLGGEHRSQTGQRRSRCPALLQIQRGQRRDGQRGHADTNRAHQRCVYTLSVTKNTTLPAGQESGLVPVTATGTGSGYNLAPGYYRILPVAVTGIASVVNDDDWLTVPGANEESDDELRDRARNQFNLVGNYHTDAIYRSMIASVLGLSVDRIFFKHDAPRGPGTANAYLLLDSGEISQPFIDAVNDYINTQGHHGHGDDMQCFALPETKHVLKATVYVLNKDNMTGEELTELQNGVTHLIRCAFRENSNYDIKKTWPYSRYSFSNLGRELHKTFPVIDSLNFSLTDIISELSVPRLDSLTVEIAND